MKFFYCILAGFNNWIVAVSIVTTGVVLLSLSALLGCVIYFKHHKKIHPNQQTGQVFEMTHNPLYDYPLQTNCAYGQLSNPEYDYPLQTISNSAYGQLPNPVYDFSTRTINNN